VPRLDRAPLDADVALASGWFSNGPSPEQPGRVPGSGPRQLNTTLQTATAVLGSRLFLARRKFQDRPLRCEKAPLPVHVLANPDGPRAGLFPSRMKQLPGQVVGATSTRHFGSCTRTRGVAEKKVTARSVA